MISSVSLNGMQAAAASFYKSAQNIVESGMQAAQTMETPDIPVTAVTGTRAVGTASTAYIASEDVIVSEMTNMMIAEQTFKANVEAYKVANEMAEALDLLVRK